MMSQIFKVLFQVGDTDIFFLHGIISAIFFSTKFSLSSEKQKKNKTKKPVESETHFCEEAIKVQSGKALKENCIAGKT